MRSMLLSVIFLCLTSYPAFPDDPPRQPVIEFVNKYYPQGTVTAVTKDSITISTPEYTYRTQVVGPDRIARWETVVLPAQPPKRFAVSEDLAAGRVPKNPRATDRPRPAYRVLDIFQYRLGDVKVGDWVCILYARVDGVDICDHINIAKRPGGLIPPLPEGVPEKSFIPYHERRNAYWDLEDKGIPYPEKFGHMRRWPIAPPPHEAPVRLMVPPPREATVPPIPPAK